MGLHPLAALIGASPLAGSVQATTGNATATSPFTGTVVDGLPDELVSADGPPVVVDEPRRLLPQPASINSPRTAVAGTNLADLPSCHQPRLELFVMSYDDMSGTGAIGVHRCKCRDLERMDQAARADIAGACPSCGCSGSDSRCTQLMVAPFAT